MTETARALNEFWSGFGMPAYMVGTVPAEQTLPYITYSLVETEPLEPATHYAQIWYRSTRNAELLAKVDEVKQIMRDDGVLIACNNGHIALRPLSPFVQIMTDAQPEIRYAYLNMQINCYHK